VPREGRIYTLADRRRLAVIRHHLPLGRIGRGGRELISTDKVELTCVTSESKAGSLGDLAINCQGTLPGTCPATAAY